VTASSAIALYWSVLLIVVLELRRELGSRGRDLQLYAALAVTSLATVVLTLLRLHAGG
jgi:hypothetical protein